MGNEKKRVQLKSALLHVTDMLLSFKPSIYIHKQTTLAALGIECREAIYGKRVMSQIFFQALLLAKISYYLTNSIKMAATTKKTLGN